jgi:hypothetical protein
MTDAERYVMDRVPNSKLSPAPVEWMVVIPNRQQPGFVEVLGRGCTEIAAWADAANRLEEREKSKVVQDFDFGVAQ